MALVRRLLLLLLLTHIRTRTRTCFASCRARKTLWSGGETTIDFVDLSDKINVIKFYGNNGDHNIKNYLEYRYLRLIDGFAIDEDAPLPPLINGGGGASQPRIVCGWDSQFLPRAKKPKISRLAAPKVHIYSTS